MKHKKIKIFAFPSHGSVERTSGVDFARIIQPMQHLAKHPDFEIYIYDPKNDTGKMDWIKVSQYYDIIYFNYTANPWAFAAMGAMARKFGKKLVLDMDDSLWNVMPDNPSFNVYKPGSEGIKNFTAIVNEVDHVTTTNAYLKNVIVHNTNKEHKHISVLDNKVDLKLYNHRSRFKDDNQITLTHFGSTTHFIDLANKEFENGIDKIMKKYPNVKLKTIGAFLPNYKNKWGIRYENAYGDRDIYKWIKEKFPIYMDETDILVTPLENNIYTQCKSAIKFMEGSTALKPGVWQDIRQYREVIKNGENGYLAKTATEWYKAIKTLIDSPVARKQIGEKAFETVKKNHQIQNYVEAYAEVFKAINEKLI